MLIEAKLLGPSQFRNDEIIEYNYFLAAQRLLHKYILLATKDYMKENLDQRREAVKNDKLKKHAKLVNEAHKKRKGTRSAVMMTLYVAL